MVVDYTFYLSEPSNIPKALELCELSYDEVKQIVGVFTKRSQWANQLRGEVCVGFEDDVIIRHHFTKKILWRK